MFTKIVNSPREFHMLGLSWPPMAPYRISNDGAYIELGLGRVSNFATGAEILGELTGGPNQTLIIQAAASLKIPPGETVLIAPSPLFEKFGLTSGMQILHGSRSLGTVSSSQPFYPSLTFYSRKNFNLTEIPYCIRLYLLER